MAGHHRGSSARACAQKPSQECESGRWAAPADGHRPSPVRRRVHRVWATHLNSRLPAPPAQAVVSTHLLSLHRRDASPPVTFWYRQGDVMGPLQPQKARAFWAPSTAAFSRGPTLVCKRPQRSLEKISSRQQRKHVKAKVFLSEIRVRLCAISSSDAGVCTGVRAVGLFTASRWTPALREAWYQAAPCTAPQ